MPLYAATHHCESDAAAIRAHDNSFLTSAHCVALESLARQRSEAGSRRCVVRLQLHLCGAAVLALLLTASDETHPALRYSLAHVTMTRSVEPGQRHQCLLLKSLRSVVAPTNHHSPNSPLQFCLLPLQYFCAAAKAGGSRVQSIAAPIWPPFEDLTILRRSAMVQSVMLLCEDVECP